MEARQAKVEIRVIEKDVTVEWTFDIRVQGRKFSWRERKRKMNDKHLAGRYTSGFSCMCFNQKNLSISHSFNPDVRAVLPVAFGSNFCLLLGM